MTTGVHRGIVLAGGVGSRLYPATAVTSKQLLPIHDKPMVYYPLSTLLLAGVDDVLVITAPTERSRFEGLLGDGERLGVRVRYAEQRTPDGIAQAFVIGEGFMDGDPVALVLGDNLFAGDDGPIRRAFDDFAGGAHVFGYPVRDPARYGVLALDGAGRVTDVVEKPARPPSPYAVPGLYLVDATAPRRAGALEPSARGELEIADLARSYLDDGLLRATLLGRGFTWLDAGTPASLLEATHFVSVVERRQGLKLGCIEEAALRGGHLDAGGVLPLLEGMPRGSYRDYVEAVAEELFGGGSPAGTR